jgi:DNA polymerase
MILYLDTETYSPVPMKNGTYEYASQAEVMLLQEAQDDSPVRVHEFCDIEKYVPQMIGDAREIVIQNSFFDRTVLRVAHGIAIPPEKIRDTMVLALSHGLPGGQGKLSEIFRLPIHQAKDKDGRRLIQLFCKPDKDGRRATRETHPIEWGAFRRYAGIDVAGMRTLYKKIPRWSETPTERLLWLLDQRINDRGFEIDVELAKAALECIAAEKRVLDASTSELTFGEVRSATQRDLLLAYLLAFYGVDLPDMQAATLERRLEDQDLPDPVRELIVNRLATVTTSTAKYKTALKSVNADGRIRGALQFAAAYRTQRWGGRIIQPQNFPRPTMNQKAVEFFIEAVKAGIARLVLPDIMAHASSALRGLIIAKPGHKLCVADLSNIEGRKLAFLAGEQWKLDAYAAFDRGVGPDMYVLAYHRAFGVALEKVTDEMRQIGKVMELALGYQGAVGAFSVMAAAYGVELDIKRIIELVKAWRKAHPATVVFWYACDTAARQVINDPTASIEVGRVRFDRVAKWMRVELPSGRFLSYPSPAIKFMKCRDCKGKGYLESLETHEDEIYVEKIECETCKGNGGKNSITYLGMNPYTKKFSRTATYGGKLAENLTQASSRDVMGVGMLRADKADYPIVLTVHDEIMAETPDTEDFSASGLAELMSMPVHWAPGLPLAAKGFETYRYRK